MTGQSKPNDSKRDVAHARPRSWVLIALVQVAAFLLGAGTMLAASLATAAFIDSPAMFISIGVLASLLLMLVISYLNLTHSSQRSRTAVAFSVSAALVFFLLFHLLFQQPLIPKADQFVRHVPDNVEMWDLRTGSTVAVRKASARNTKRSYPIVFLHGGPGGYAVSFQPITNALPRLAADGYDVYLYDQAGGGLSIRLDNVAEYTLDRHIRDLEAIYERIGSNKIILIGSSWGATLGANYMAKFPEQVAAAVFSGSGPIYLPHWKEIGDGTLDAKLSQTQRRAFSKMVQTPRLFAAIALAETNPRAAVNFASDQELGSLFDKAANTFYLGAAVCKGGPLANSSGFGFWSNRMTGKSLRNRTDDPRPTLRTNDTPVLVLRGECDYKKEAVAREYLNVFPNAEFISFQKAGHMVYWEEPERYLQQVREFLTEVID